MTISNSDVLRMRDGPNQSNYDQRPPASPTGVMPSPYRSAIKRSSKSSGSDPSLSASQPVGMASSPDLLNTLPELPRISTDGPMATQPRTNADLSRSTPASTSSPPTSPIARVGSSTSLLAFGRFAGKGKEAAKPAVVT